MEASSDILDSGIKTFKRYVGQDEDDATHNIYRQRAPNFPPFLNLVYYDPKDVPIEYRREYLLSNITALIIECGLILNFATTIVIALHGHYTINTLYSSLNFFLVTILNIYVLLSFFYCLINPTPSGKKKYYMQQTIMIGILTMFIVASNGSINGILRLGELSKIIDPKLENITTYWAVSTFIEIVLYGSAIGLSAYCIYLMIKIKQSNDESV